MKRLLRSVIDFQDGKITPEALNTNYLRLRDSRIEWMLPADEKIFKFVNEYFTDNYELPSSATVDDYFTRSNDVEVTERVKDLATAQHHTHKNFEHLLKQLLEDQNRVKMKGVLKEVDEIISKGLIIAEGREKTRIQGVRDGLVYFNQKVHELIPADANARTRGDLVEDVETSWQQYLTAKHNKDKVWGKFTGINEIDTVCRGLKRGEMWVHAAYTGELKTTFALNWCYNLVTRYRTNVVYVSMEMPYEQVRLKIHVIHSFNKKWGRKPLDYRAVRDGELSPEDEEFYQKVLQDFASNPEHCKFHVWCPDKDVSIDDIRIETELRHKEFEVGFVVLDHGGLMESRKKHKDYTIELNAVLRDSKKYALHFNGGEGVPVLMLFQLNRQGKDEADKSEGRYKLKALSYSNEAERSADYVTTTYLNDQHRQDKTTLFCNLKNRDNPLFAPFIASVDFSCGRLFNYDSSFSTAPNMNSDDVAHSMTEI